jgi:cytidine deaminase
MPTDRLREEDLIQAALAVRQRAYAPYSKFQVGAALLSATGEIFLGCNVENVSYGLTQCAERAAITAAVALGQREFTLLAIASPGGVSPCGACRQVLAEFCADLPILLIDADQAQAIIRVNLAKLFPSRFSLANLPGSISEKDGS